MTDTELLQEILTRLSGLEEGQRTLEEGQRTLEEGQRKLEEGQRKLERKVDGQQTWFQTLAQKVDAVEQMVRDLRGELGDVRELMAHLREDDIVQKRAIANLSVAVDALKADQPAG